MGRGRSLLHRAQGETISVIHFSLYPFWLPGDGFGRIIALLPLVYAVQWKRSVYVSILVHRTLNLVGTVGLAAVINSSGK